ncbi:MAG: pyridoxal phosphate-dependent aminotransferase [Nitrospinota bacterium]|nr:MAG: pyridoxal phosphate-dependent aminotransferase [Nitrospinota bacterium]
MEHLAARMARLGTETAFDMLAKAKALEAQGREILHFEIGEPDFDTPQNIKEAAMKALRDGYTHYCPAPGIPELREAIAAHISRTRNIPVDPEEVVVTPGAKPIMFFTILALVNEGDEVIYPNPGFPIYESMINFVGGKPVPIPLLEKHNFSFDLNRFADSLSDKTKLIILNSPNNPTGGIIPPEDIRKVAELIRGKPIFVLSDEIYQGMQYSGTPLSIASLPEMKAQTIILDGFSKLYAMTGWRLGYGIMDKALAPHITKLIVNSNSCTATFIQKAGVEALTGPQEASQEMVRIFQRRRDLIVNGLNAINGVRCAMPQGAFYAFPNVESFGKKSEFIANYLLEKAGIACLSGTAFGKYGEGFLRFSYANSEENIQKGLERLEKALATL